MNPATPRTLLFAIATALLAGPVLAGPLERDRAKRIHDRLVGIPPSGTMLDDMEADLIAGDVRGAALATCNWRTARLLVGSDSKPSKSAGRPGFTPSIMYASI